MARYRDTDEAYEVHSDSEGEIQLPWAPVAHDNNLKEMKLERESESEPPKRPNIWHLEKQQREQAERELALEAEVRRLTLREANRRAPELADKGCNTANNYSPVICPACGKQSSFYFLGDNGPREEDLEAQCGCRARKRARDHRIQMRASL